MYLREYELIYVVRPDLADEDLDKIQTRTVDSITGGGGHLLSVDVWGKRKLAYEIQKFNKGHYVLIGFLAESSLVAEVERLLRIDDTVLRFLSVKVEDRAHVETRVAEAAVEAAAKKAAAAESPSEEHAPA